MVGWYIWHSDKTFTQTGIKRVSEKSVICKVYKMEMLSLWWQGSSQKALSKSSDLHISLIEMWEKVDHPKPGNSGPSGWVRKDNRFIWEGSDSHMLNLLY